MKTIREIITSTCATFRKGSDLIVNGEAASDEDRATMESTGTVAGGGVVEMFLMPPAEAASDKLTMIDVHFLMIGVDLEKAQELKPDFVAWLKENIPNWIEGEISYIQMGGIVEDQQYALCIFAIGEALGMWRVLTPARMGIPEPLRDMMAGNGFVSIMSGDIRGFLG